MPKISKKPCDFIVEETPPLKFVIIPPLSSPLEGGMGEGVLCAFCGGLYCYNKRICQRKKLFTFLYDSAAEGLNWPCALLEKRCESIYLWLWYFNRCIQDNPIYNFIARRRGERTRIGIITQIVWEQLTSIYPYIRNYMLFAFSVKAIPTGDCLWPPLHLE